MGSLLISYPWWYIVGCLLAGLAGALFLYYKDRTFIDKPLSLRVALAVLRGLIITILCFLLLSPQLRKIETEIRKPIIVVLQDASESISKSLSEVQQKELEDNLVGFQDALMDQFDVEVRAFGSEVRQGPDFSFVDKETDMEQALRHVREVYDPQRLGAVVLLSDGLFNRGAYPLYSPDLTKAPIYALGLGNADPVKDLAIKRIFHNKVAYKGDKFTVQIDVGARNAKGEQAVCSVFDISSGSPRLLQKEQIALDDDPFFTTREIILDATESGIRRYRFVLNRLDGERNIVNNSREMAIEVLDARQKILILADAPHPDISAIRQSLASGRNYQVDLRMQQEPGQPLRAYDLVILHQVPSLQRNAATLLQELQQSGIPAWFILGEQSDIRTFNGLQELLQIRGDGKNLNEVTAQIAPGFQLFTLSEEVTRRITQFPPLVAPFGEFIPGPGARILARQRIGSVVTDYPLWVLGEQQQFKMGILAGEGLWKWRMFDFLQHNNHAIVDELVSKTVQFLALKEDKRRFRVVPSRPIFKENEAIVLDGELYNDNYERINIPDVQVVIRNEEGKEFPFAMNKTSDMYSLSAGIFPPGTYSYAAITNFNQVDLKASGSFLVQALDQELADLQADHNLLRLLAEESGGEMVVGVNGLAGMANTILENKSIKPVMYSSTKTKPLIDWRWLFGILLILLGAEWFVRRYTGAY